uniref:Uncharacterized protein n=1 Tax=Tanacetum cinerariifolium TaxID=118510 RepID=A0A6L2KMF6_TANCI|nr:hypothetical protein [Tanacetum cinerariifolium]
MTQATIQADQITTKSVQRISTGNKGKQIATGSQGKLETCYNYRGQGHIARECKEEKREKDSQWFKDKALLMEAKEKGVVLDAEAEAFLADVECTAHYDDSLAITTTTAFEANLTGTSTREGTCNDTDFHSKVESNKSLKTKSEKLKTDNKAREDSYHEELVWLRHANKVVTELLQSYGQLVQTVPMLSKRPTFASKDLHKTALENMKDSECLIISSPINCAKLNNLYDTFVPQKELTGEQAYWLPANEVSSNQSKPAQQFVRTRPAKSQVNSHLKTFKSCFLKFDEVVKFKIIPTCLTDGEWRFEHTKRCFVEQIIPFHEKLKTRVKGIEDNLFKEVSEYMKIFDELDKEYDQYICSVVLTPDNVVPISVEPCSNCDKEQTKNLELEAEISKLKEQLQGKDNIIGKLKAYINNMKDVSTCPSLSTLEIENTHLKEELTTIRIKNDSLRDENVSIKAHFQELYKFKAGSNSSVSSGATIPVKPKAIAFGLYAMTPKYVPPHKRINREAHIPSPRKETVNVVDLTNVPINLTTGIKFVLEARKSKSQSDKKTHKNFPARSQNVKRVEKSLRNLNKKNRVDSSLNDKRKITVVTLVEEQIPPARSCVMQCTLPTQGIRSIISTVSIRPEGFLPSILLFVVIVVAIVIVVVTVILVVVVVTVVRVVIVVVISRVVVFSPGGPVGLFYSDRLGVCIPPGQGIVGVSLGLVFLLELSVFAILASCASRAEAIPSTISFRMAARVMPGGGVVDLTGDEDPTNEDGDTKMGDSIGVSVSLGGEIFFGEKKSHESNIGDSDNTGDGDKIVDGAIEACSGGIGKITVVTLVEERMSPWHGNLPRLPIRSNIVCLDTNSIALEGT